MSPFKNVHKRGLRLVLFYCLVVASDLSIGNELKEIWSLKGIFNSPESAVFDVRRNQVYVSNVNGYAKDGNGFISRVSANGEVLDLKWIEGINSPTGIRIHRDHLYVVDYDQLVVVDLDSKEIVLRAVTKDIKPALNDVAITDSGRVFVSGSASSTIYQLVGDALQVWKHDEVLLKHVNGLYADQSMLVVGGKEWLAYDSESAEKLDGFAQLNPKKIDIDGIAKDACGNFLITLIDDARLWRVDLKGVTSPVSVLDINAIDMDFVAGRLYAAALEGGLSVYELRTDCQQ